MISSVENKFCACKIALEHKMTHNQTIKRRFDWINFFIEPWGGAGAIFSTKKNLLEKNGNTHKSTQFFMLIPNMIIVWVKPLCFFTQICEILLKKTKNHVSRIVWSGVSQVAMFFLVWKIDIFVALEKVYQMR